MNIYENVIELLKSNNIIIEGHFKLTSGNHSNIYIQKDLIHHFPEAYSQVQNALEHLSNDFKFDVITGPAIAGAVIARDIATLRKVPFVYPEKIIDLKELENNIYQISEMLYNNDLPTKMTFRRGHDKFINGKRILIIEDIITTGKSIKQTADVIYQCGGTVSGVVAIWNRCGWNEIRTSSIINQSVEHFSPEECPLCKSNIPLQDPKK